VILVCCIGLAPTARVSADELPPGYAEAVTAALNELEADNYPEAREEFRRAHAIFPNARTLRGLGMVEFELRNYVQSVTLLEEALASNVRPLDGKLRTDAESLLARAQRYVGEVAIDVEPSEANLVVDGSPLRVNDKNVIRLEVGEHTLEAQAAGHIAEKRTVQVVGGERVDLRIRLSTPTAKAARESGQPGGAHEAERRPVYKKWWLWTTLAVVVAGGAATAAILLSEDKEKPTPVNGTNTVGVNLQTLSTF
jgi:tetratricopeptide (TPR) repeat protein